MKRRVIISDHAMLRYLERVGGFEIEKLRGEIGARLQPYSGIGYGAVVIDGHAYVIDSNPLKGAILVTVLPSGSAYRGILRARRGDI
ncbi:hypothetical protein [Paracoccus sp. (in: a-proteobacteria)]|uniref:hypothetical protein n=1 Tax=Paracoccus sp. TaxID=267 RepID=UPI0028AA2CD0|nr:hypothetical protein [Paracoccus sp. (in: a-proteobacteria)]